MKSKTVLADVVNGHYVFEISLHEGRFTVEVVSNMLISIAYCDDGHVIKNISTSARSAIEHGINQELKANKLCLHKNYLRCKLLCQEVMVTRPYIIGVK